MIRFGANPIAWSNDDDRSLGADISLEQCLGEAASIGFEGIEKGHKFPTDPTALKAVLAPYGLDFISGWHSLNLLAHDVAAEKQAIQPHLDLLNAMGCNVCIVCETSNAIHGDNDAALVDRPVLPAAELTGFAGAVEEIAAHCQRQRIDLVYHHHMGTIIQTRAEIDAFMAATGPATKLLLDTGHATFAGADPADLAHTYMPRIRHIHAKNIRPAIMERALGAGMSFLQAVREGVFTVPGDPDGSVDFRAVLDAAAAQNYAGWLVIEAEQDPTVYNPVEYQSMGLGALRESWQAAQAGSGS